MKFILLSLLLLSTTSIKVSLIKNFRKHTVSSILSLSLLLNSQQSHAVELEKPPAPGTCVTTSNPSTTTQWCRQLGLLPEGRLRGCQANENCFSTSSRSATKYMSPWQYEFTSSISSSSSSSSTTTTATLEDEVWENLKGACKGNGLKILQDKNDGEHRYLLAAEMGSNVPKQTPGSSLFYEFTLKPSDKLILFRAVVDKTIFLYPLQQPVSDFGALKSRLDSIRDTAKFLQIGGSENDDALLLE